MIATPLSSIRQYVWLKIIPRSVAISWELHSPPTSSLHHRFQGRPTLRLQSLKIWPAATTGDSVERDRDFFFCDGPDSFNNLPIFLNYWAPRRAIVYRPMLGLTRARIKTRPHVPPLYELNQLLPQFCSVQPSALFLSCSTRWFCRLFHDDDDITNRYAGPAPSKLPFRDQVPVAEDAHRLYSLIFTQSPMCAWTNWAVISGLLDSGRCATRYPDFAATFRRQESLLCLTRFIA